MWTRWVSSYAEYSTYYRYRDIEAELTGDGYNLLRCFPVYPAFAAALGGLGELVSSPWLARDIDMNVTDLEGTPLLQYAILSGSAELVELLITMGAESISLMA